jgi:isopenicillin-N N-acyltransferase-like protein
VGASGGEIIDLETSPDHVSYLYPADGVVSHSNHFVGSGHGESQMEKIGPNTLYRADRLKRLLRGRGDPISVDSMKAAMSDHFAAPNAICRHPDARQPEAKRTMTAGAVLIDLDRRVMHVADGPPCENPFAPFTIDGDE